MQPTLSSELNILRDRITQLQSRVAELEAVVRRYAGDAWVWEYSTEGGWWKSKLGPGPAREVLK